MMNNEYFSFPKKDKLTDALVAKVVSILENSLHHNKKASLLVSGGNTPKLFLNKLSKSSIDWKNITIGLVDERWIETNDQNSNERMIKNELLINNAKNATFIGMYNQDVFENSSDKCSSVYSKYFNSIDVLILGMGLDGHTASLFPNNIKLDEAFDIENSKFCISIIPDNAPYNRMSLTLASILSAENIFLHIEGKEKLRVYNEVLQENDKYKYPIVKVLQSNKSIKVYSNE